MGIKLGMIRPRLSINSYYIINGLVMPQSSPRPAPYYSAQFGLIMSSIVQSRTKKVEVQEIYSKRVEKQFCYLPYRSCTAVHNSEIN